MRQIIALLFLNDAAALLDRVTSLPDALAEFLNEDEEVIRQFVANHMQGRAE